MSKQRPASKLTTIGEKKGKEYIHVAMKKCAALKEPLKNDELGETDESPTKSYYLVRRGGDGFDAKAGRVFQRFLISLLIVLLSSVSIGNAKFSDVEEQNPYRDAIEYLELNDIYSGSSFYPKQSITRGEFAEWILRNAGFSDSAYEPITRVRFKDVPLKKLPQAPYIYKLIDVGVIDFTDFDQSKFNPKQTITKREALEWLFSLEGISVPKIFDETLFKATDVDVHSPHAAIVNKALSLEILEPGKVGIHYKLSRALAAHFLQKTSIGKNVVTIQLVNENDADFVNSKEYDTLVATWNRINSHYLRKDTIDRSKLLYGAVEGIVDELDDKHSTFERPGDNALVESLNGQVEGIGAVLNDQDGEIVVVTPIIGSPAEKAGILPNDIIREVDGMLVKGMKLKEIVSRIKGKKGTSVKIKVLREQDFKTFTIIRDIVKIKSVNYEWTEDAIFIIRISTFGSTTDAEFAAALEVMKEKEPKGIIIDLRYNPGGFLHVVNAMAGHFIPKGDVITTVRYPDHSEKENSNGTGELKGKKIVVLVNKGSASASEILAGALQDYKIATIIGETTYGKGTVQELDDFIDGSTLKLTIAEWLTPKGNEIDGKGITPDIIVKNTAQKTSTNQKKNKKDIQLERAKEAIRFP